MASHRDYVTNVTHTHTIVNRYFGSSAEGGLLAKTYGRARCTVPLLVVTGVTTLHKKREATYPEGVLDSCSGQE